MYLELKNFPFAGEAVGEKKEDAQHLFQGGNFQQSCLLKEAHGSYWSTFWWHAERRGSKM